MEWILGIAFLFLILLLFAVAVDAQRGGEREKMILEMALEAQRIEVFGQNTTPDWQRIANAVERIADALEEKKQDERLPPPPTEE